LAKVVAADTAVHGDSSPELPQGISLVGPLAAWKVIECFTEDGFTFLRDPGRRHSHIHIQAADN